MTYTVLGASGFIGSRLTAALKKVGATVNAPGRGVDIYSKPLGTIFYCIGLTNDYKDRPHDTIEAHVSVLNTVLQSADFTKLIYLSSTRLYDGLKSGSEKTDLALNPANPRHLYDLSKALGENLCLNYSKGRACAVRLSSVYDEGENASGFMPDLLRRLQKERTFELASNSGIVRDYIYVGDVVQSLIKLADSKESGIINLASGENVSNQDIVDALNGIGCKITLSRETPRETPAICDISRLKALGIQPVPVRGYLKYFLRKG